MSNFTNPHGGPYVLRDPYLHDELNALVEQLLKAPNFDDGSAHAPTGDVELSGSMGGGFEFSDLFPFRGDLLVNDGLIFDGSGGLGYLRTTVRVPFDVLGAMTHSGASAIVQWSSGASATWNTGTTLTLASGATAQLTGAVNVRGTMTIKSTANGGPGTVIFEDTSVLTLNANAAMTVNSNNVVWGAPSVQGYVAGAEIAGVYTRSGRTIFQGAGARDQHRVAVVLPANANADITIEADRYRVQQTLTGNRLYTLRHTPPYVPQNGERIRVYRTGAATPSAHTAKIRREDGTIIWSFYLSTEGFAVFEYISGIWECVEGAQFMTGAASGFYDDVW